MSKKNRSSVAVAHIVPTTPRVLTFTERLDLAGGAINGARLDATAAVIKFRNELASRDGNIAYVLEWQAQAVLRAECFLGLTRLDPGFLLDVASLSEDVLAERFLKEPEVAEAVSIIAAPYIEKGLTPEEAVRLGVAIYRVRQERASIQRYLMGEGFSSSEGPWDHTSTNPVANLNNIQKANAHRWRWNTLAAVLRYLEQGV